MKLSPKVRSRINDRLVLRINELYHDLENRLYDTRHGGMHAGANALWKQFFETYLPRESPRRVLDYGCGTGYVSRLVAPFLGETDTLTCADVSAEMLKVCQDNVRKDGAGCQLSAVKISSTRIDLPDASLDVIATNSVLHHLPDLDTFAAECHRILKPGGHLLVGHEPNGERADHHAVVRADLLARIVHDPAHFVNLLVERSPLLERLLRGFLSRVSTSYRRRNAMLRTIARTLRQEGLIDIDLRGTEIQQIVDIHTDKGFRESTLMNGPFSRFDRIQWITRGFITTGSRPGPFHRWNNRYAARFPRAGCNLSFVLRKRP